MIIPADIYKNSKGETERIVLRNNIMLPDGSYDVLVCTDKEPVFINNSYQYKGFVYYDPYANN